MQSLWEYLQFYPDYCRQKKHLNGALETRIAVFIQYLELLEGLKCKGP